MSSQKRLMLLKKAVNYVSYLLVFLSVIFIGYKFYTLQGLVNLTGFFKDHGLVFTVACLVYALNNYLLAAGWRLILAGLDEKITIKLSVAIFGVSQIAKYIPGNIFQFAGKQVLAVRHNLNSAKVAKSQFLEIILLLLSSLPFSIYVGVYYFLEMGVALSIFTSFLFFLGASFIINRISTNFFRTFSSYMIFMFVSGLMFFLIVTSTIKVNSTLSLDAFVLCSFVAAWLIGFIMPGSPAGLGVRESILILLLFPVFRDQSLVFNAAILTRLVTVIGDLIFFIFSSTVQRFIDSERQTKRI
ncbi:MULTISPECIES: hypothetical protein [Pantoea]|uniref:hypothetical protein n=1 Tax=Pantoea TaxID=53335 RepID=UPI0015FA460F|nr:MULTISPECIES: hypothetical protein [Pantoea]MBB1227500.1 hypothetical protein [Pantoea pleuroti]MDH1171720.1 hypothetical protein [Pantoea agglomerans]